MKLKFTIISTLLLTISTLFAGATIQDITASNYGDNIMIRWTSIEETNLKHYIVQRSDVNVYNFIDLKIVEPKGNYSSYNYEDISAYKTTSRAFVYRLKIVNNNDQDPTYSKPITATSGVSGVKSTWGSIKAMFR